MMRGAKARTFFALQRLAGEDFFARQIFKELRAQHVYTWSPGALYPCYATVSVPFLDFIVEIFVLPSEADKESQFLY